MKESGESDYKKTLMLSLRKVISYKRLNIERRLFWSFPFRAFLQSLLFFSN